MKSLIALKDVANRNEDQNKAPAQTLSGSDQIDVDCAEFCVKRSVVCCTILCRGISLCYSLFSCDIRVFHIYGPVSSITRKNLQL